jgi:hypothetical protein
VEGKRIRPKYYPAASWNGSDLWPFYFGVVDETNVKVYQCLPKEKGSIYVNVII